jgi:hypothetical protein
MHCLSPNAAEVRFDKKGRPYTVCKVCWTKSFYQTLDALRGVAVIPQLVENAMRMRTSDPQYARRFDEQVHATIACVQNATRPSAVPLAEATAPAPFDAETPAAKVGT